MKQMPPYNVVEEWFIQDGPNLLWRKTKWRNAPAGSIAGAIASNGYRCLLFNGQRLLSHRLAWYLNTGHDPIGRFVDHIDGNKLNNAPSNLRLIAQINNKHNVPTRSYTTSEASEVYYCPTLDRWVASIWEGNKRRTLGAFRDKESAIQHRLGAGIMQLP